MSLSELPLPSIEHVLASNHVYLARPPSIDFDRDHFPATSQTYMMTSSDQRDYESLEYQFLSYILRAQPVRPSRCKSIRHSYYLQMQGVQASMRSKPERERSRKAICILSNALNKFLHAHTDGSFFRKLRH